MRHRVEHHELGLHVGGETGVFGGAKTLRPQVRKCGPICAHAQTTGHGFNADASVAQFVDDGFQMVTTRVLQHHVATGGRDRAQEGARFNAVGHHAVRSTMQRGDTLDVDAAGAVAFDLRAHGNQQLGQVGNLGFLRRVFQHGFALGQGGGHEEVFSARDGHHVGSDACALQTCAAVFQARHHVALLDINDRAHGLQAFDVLVHGAGANGATARQGHLGVAKARQQRTQRQHRGAHGFHQFIGRFGGVQLARVQHHVTRFIALGAHAHVANQLDHGRDVLQTRHVGQRHRVCRQQGGTQLGQRGVLRARNGHVAVQRTTAANQQFIHTDSGLQAWAFHSAGVKVFIDKACTSSLAIFSPKVA